MFDRTEKELIANWPRNTSQPTVSICCTTFNHERFIAQSIEGFLQQKTDFPFEIIIHDDASTDSTPAIIADFAARFPKVIRVIQQTENQYSQNPHLPVENVLRAAKGDYIALCEGDDYWIHHEKLAMQLETLRSNPKLSGCTTFTYRHENGSLKQATTDKGYDLTLTKFCMGKKAETRTLTNFFRASVINDFKLADVSRLQNTDNYLRLLILGRGLIRVLPVYTGVYRIHAGGVWSAQDSVRSCKIKSRDLAGFSLIAPWPVNIIFMLRFVKSWGVYQAIKLKKKIAP